MKCDYNIFVFFLNRLQFDIAKRGLQMLKCGGLLVYSTCSLNPLEDEAVVAELLRRFPGFVYAVVDLWIRFEWASPFFKMDPPFMPFKKKLCSYGETFT